MKSGATQQQLTRPSKSDGDPQLASSTMTQHTRSGLSSLLAPVAPPPTVNASGASVKPARFVISRPIRGIMQNPLQVKVQVPRAGRSIEYQLSKAVPDPSGSRPPPGAEDPALTQALKAAQESVYLSIQAHRPVDESCNTSMCSHTHFDLVIRLATDCLLAAHLLCKVVYQNVRGELKEMGPYLLHAVDQVSSYRLEEMNCKVSTKTGHHHVYLLVQLASAEPATPAPHLPSHALLPADFCVQWSPLATLRLVGSGEPSGPDLKPVFCVPQVMALCSDEIRDLLPAGGAGELVLHGLTQSDLLLLVRLTYPGTSCAVTGANVHQVLRLAARLRVPHLLATAERFLCACVRGSAPGSARRSELAGLASTYGLQALTEALRADG